MGTSEEWTPSTEHPGYMVKTIKRELYSVEIYRPILEDAEKKKREAYLKSVAERVLSNYYIRKEREKHEQQNNN